MNTYNNLLFVTTEFPPEPGGIGYQASSLANHLVQKSDIKLNVLTNSRGDISREIEYDNSQPYEVVRIPRRKPVILTYVDRIRQYVRLLDTTSPFIILASGRFSIWITAFFSFFFPKQRYVAILHGSELNSNNFLSKAFLRWSFRQFDQLVAVSHFTANLANKIVPHSKIIVIPNGVDAFRFPICFAKKRRGHIPDPAAPQLITLGNMTRRKGQHNVIRAIPYLLRTFPRLTYHIVGLPSEKDALERLAEKLEVKKHVIFHGPLSDEGLRKLFLHMDCFLMLSENLPNGDIEGFGMAILEANALGIPAIGSLGCGIADAIDDGKTGILVNPFNPSEICNALNALLENFPYYSSNALSWSRKFSWASVTKRYIEVLGLS